MAWGMTVRSHRARPSSSRRLILCAEYRTPSRKTAWVTFILFLAVAFKAALDPMSLAGRLLRYSPYQLFDLFGELHERLGRFFRGSLPPCEGLRVPLSGLA